MSDDYPLANELIYWIQARELARNGECKDPNINNYRYCNVRREHDKVTKWIAENWRKEGQNTLPALLMARLFNQPRTLRRVGYPYEWNEEKVLLRLQEMQEKRLKIFNAAYIVSTNGLSMDKCEYVVMNVLNPVFNAPSMEYPELGDVWQALTRHNGVGSFIGAQVVADWKQFGLGAKSADWWTFVAPGPGSMRGLNRVRGLEAKAMKYNIKSFSPHIQALRGIITSGTGLELCAQDTQNCLCEFDKYQRLVTGEGKPKQQYKRS